MKKKLYLGDCLEILKTIPENRIDTCITDPPYELGFMNKDWDSAGISFQKETWEAVYRVLKPGALLLAFGGTRTWHRIAVAIEDAGFEIRDTICWLHGQGFPKSYNIGKGIDKKAGKEREVVGVSSGPNNSQYDGERYKEKRKTKFGDVQDQPNLTAPATPEAELWEGYGTALKPAFEPIIIAMKPIDGTFVNNALIHGVAGMWIDGGRIPTQEYLGRPKGQEVNAYNRSLYKEKMLGQITSEPDGRWPSNVILDETSAEMLDKQTEYVGNTKPHPVKSNVKKYDGYGNITNKTGEVINYNEPNANGASRFFKTVEDSCSLCYNTYTKSINKESGIWKQLYVNNVEKNSKTTQVINENIAQLSALERADENLVQNVKDAGSLCDLCGISIAHALVAIKNSDSSQEELQAMLDYIGSYKSSILIQNLVSFVELWENTDIIPTTKSLSILFGSVHHAITNYIQETKKLELLRFKYQPKASKKERNMGLDDLPDKQKYAKDGSSKSHEIFTSESANDEAWAKKNPNLPTKNTHATVKPLALMEYLCKLTRTPTGGIVLDPFMGSGTTGMACVNTDRDFIGIELVEEHYIIARKRIEYTQQLLKEN